MNSGVAVLSLPKNQYAYGQNTTCRGRYLTHRPPYRKQALILDAGVDFSKSRFQGACYYKPDFGSESIVAQIGGRIYQFVPDTVRSATVYDRTIKDFFNGAGFVENTASTNIQYSVVLQNVNDTSAAIYPPKTQISSDPTLITTTVSAASSTGTGNALRVVLILPASTSLLPSLAVGKQIYVQFTQVIAGGALLCTITAAAGASGSNYSITIKISNSAGESGTVNFPAGTAIFATTNPAPPAVLGSTTAAFTAPAVGQQVTVLLGQPFFGAVGSGILIGTAGSASTIVKGSGEIVTGAIYSVVSIPQPTQKTTVTTQVETTSNNSLQFGYDPNPAGISTAWLWQSENYVIINDGFSRPIFFNGVSSRRSITPTFIGSVAESFSVPQIGQVVSITLNAPFQDAVGTFIQVSALNLFPFLMQVISITGNTVIAVNINGQTAVNSIIPISTPINSTASPTYSGVMSGNIPGILAPGTPFTISVSPPFTGNVGDDIILTDGTGELTAYTFNVTAIAGGGSSLTVTNINAPTGTIVQVGYPVISENTGASELPVGRMGAYVQGRNWISSPDGKSFIASDLVGSSSGTQALNFRDAVLKWSQNTAKFPIPGGAGEINCIIALNALDASLGQGALQVLCDNDVFNCSAPTDSTQWAQVKTPILSESIIGFGGVGQSGAVVSNGDLIFKSGDGTIHSLKLSRQDFNQWGNLPISQEVNRVIEQENINQLAKITETICDNRALISCAPIDSAGGIFSQGLITIDFDVTSSLQGKLPSVYDGVWKDGNFLQLISGKFNKVDRTFAFLWNSVSGQVELWEILKAGTADDDGTPVPKPIVWSFESPMIFNDVKGKGEFDRIDSQDGRIFVSDIVGDAKITVWYRPDWDSCWHVWHELAISNTGEQPGYSVPIGLGRPKTDESTITSQNKQPAHVGRFFQTRTEITGSLIFQGFEATASLAPEPQNQLPVKFQTI